MKKNDLESLCKIVLCKKENLKDQFDFWLLEQNIHIIKGIKKLLVMCNGPGFMDKYVIIEDPNMPNNSQAFASFNAGYTVTANLLYENDIFLVIPKKLAEKLLQLESFKNSNKNNI